MNGAMDNFTGLSRVKVYCRLWTVGHQFGNVRSTSFEYELKYGTFLRAFAMTNNQDRMECQSPLWRKQPGRQRERETERRLNKLVSLVEDNFMRIAEDGVCELVLFRL